MHDWFASFDPLSSLWKTSQRSLVEDLETFSETWPRSGMMLGGTAFQLPPLAPLTAATGSGLLPTPEASNTKASAMRSGGRSPRDFLAPLPSKAFALGMVQKPTHSIPTPTASDHIVRECTSSEALNFETNKSVSLNRWVGMWPTPHANCGTGAGQAPNKTGGLNLQTAVRRWPTPCSSMAKGSSPASLTRKNGADRSNDRLDHAVMASDSGQLNPTWVEWLMGFPLDWTAPMAQMKNTIRKRARKATASVETCQACGATGPLERHHPNYETPDVVEVLCAPCHVKADQRDGTRKVKATKACTICGANFLPTHSKKHTICSPECRVEAGRRNAAKRWGAPGA